GRAIPTVHALDLAGDEAVTNVVDARTTVTVDRRPEEPKASHFGHDVPVEPFMAVGVAYPGHQLRLAIIARRLKDEALVVLEHTVHIERVFPFECHAGFV